MADKDGNRSNPYHLNPEKACEACCFGSGKHAGWCEEWIRAGLREYFPHGVPFPPPGEVYEVAPGACLECGGNCAPRCGEHPMGCIYGGPASQGYWLVSPGCPLEHLSD